MPHSIVSFLINLIYCELVVNLNLVISDVDKAGSHLSLYFSYYNENNKIAYSHSYIHAYIDTYSCFVSVWQLGVRHIGMRYWSNTDVLITAPPRG